MGGITQLELGDGPASAGTGSSMGIAGTFAMTLTLNEGHNRPCTTSLSILRQVIVLSGAGKITKD